ncbi:short-chain dehydrogenase [Bradyrhizobium canariense]|uniref:Short-chain dehydrogenase n=1 Tax=Bradyrhizobium canariense TaxID=255045 RepID=A0ABX3X5G7_9BRAD|nr:MULTISPECIES: SDR family oxidoreductase [Bradyrhizobium]OSJ17369.1 short-chain dehydrogenase [Bradyrhizobium canariense]OSJ30538.1 short-chain dehydrogenase [Bradyrhizobium canariense]WOH61837.1 SDR family oxidoreductase [Bradyrhizobium sp. BWC-3-1]
MQSEESGREVPGRSRPVVVITGASAGVGRAIAHRFGRAGYAIGLIARDAEALEEVRREIEGVGGRAVVMPLDVADAGAVFAAADRIASTLGPIDIWINDAMVTVFSPVWRMTPDEFRRVTEVTYLGFVHGTMAALCHMRPANRGTIIQIGSALAYRGIPLQSAYCGAKHAIRGFTDSLRSELRHEQSRINLVMLQLPAVNTPQFDWARAHMSHSPRPVAPVVEPEVIANAVYDAAQRPAREYWIGFSTLKVIFGNMIVPGLLDRYLAQTCISGQQTDRPIDRSRPDNLDRPLDGLHRTRGSFGSEATNRAFVGSASMLRLAPLAALLGTVALALTVQRGASRSRRRAAEPRRQRNVRFG